MNIAKSRLDDLARALRLFAEKMCDHPENFSQDDEKVLDRALRSCPTISDIDVVWVAWGYWSKKHGWNSAKLDG